MEGNKKETRLKSFFKPVTDSVLINTFISLDLSGALYIDGKNSCIEFSEEKISLVSENKRVYIYGEDMIINSCSGKNIHISGVIRKIELFEV